MRIMVISRGIPSEKYPLNGIFEYDQAKALSSLGYEVIYIYLDLRSIRRWRKWGTEIFEIGNLKVFGINFPIGRIPTKMFLYLSELILKIIFKKIVKKWGRPEVLHAHFTEIGYVSAKLKETVRIPLVLTEHSSKIMSPIIDENLNEVTQFTYNKSDKIISVSIALKSALMNVFNTESIYIPNIVDTNTFRYSEKNKSKTFTFITVGNLVQSKRIDLIILALNRIYRVNHNIRLIIVGEGPERNHIEMLVRENSLNDIVVLKGLLKRTEIAKYLNESHCFVLPSRVETFGVAYVEAMLTGLPVIATKCGGPESFVNETNGLLIEVDNIIELTYAMEQMISSIDMYNGEKISTEIVQKFSSKKIAEQILQVYRQAIS